MEGVSKKGVSLNLQEFERDGIKNITKLRVQFRNQNAHKCHHNFQCTSFLCNCGMSNEDSEHYLIHCSLFNQSRRGLFDTVTENFGSNIANLDSVSLCNLLLYGNYNLTLVENRTIIEATIEYIKETN